MPKLRQNLQDQDDDSVSNGNALALYPYQREAVTFLEERRGLAGLFAEMGTGKTPITLHYLLQADATRVLVVCPLSVIGVWEREAKRWRMPFRLTVLNSGTIKQRALAVPQARIRQHDRIDRIKRMVVVNYESYWRDPLRKALVNYAPDAIVLDEAHRVKGRNTNQTLFATKLAGLPSVKHRLALTGTPVMNGIEDLFSIYRFIDPSVFGRAWADFERRYIIKGGYGGYQIVGYRGQEEIKSLLAKTAFQISKADALDLPERVSQVIPVALSPKTRAVYEQMRKQAIVELDAPGIRGVAISRIVLTTMLRLQQITGGFLPVVGDGINSIADIGDDKLKVAVELAEDAVLSGEKVVIFCRFIHDIKRLKQAMPKAGILSGSIKPETRERTIDRLRDGTISVLLVQIATGALGIDLTAASVSIFYSTGYSLGEFLQARDRLHRHGQTKRVIEYLLQAEKTIDETIFKALTTKQQIARKVTDLDYAKGLLR